jgi:hypothetical protein
MVMTEYTQVDEQELIQLALFRDNRTAMEIELAQRLYIRSLNEDAAYFEYCDDSGSKGKAAN